MSVLNQQFIQSILFDWEKVGRGSYLRGIEAFQGLELDHSITFFVGENGSGKSTLLEAIAVAHGFNPEGGSKNYRFSTRDTHSELWEAIRLVRGTAGKNGDIFSGPKAFTMWQHRRKAMRTRGTLPPDTTKNPMARAFWCWRRTI